jgi:hypothetical protein
MNAAAAAAAAAREKPAKLQSQRTTAKGALLVCRECVRGRNPQFTPLPVRGTSLSCTTWPLTAPRQHVLRLAAPMQRQVAANLWRKFRGGWCQTAVCTRSECRCDSEHGTRASPGQACLLEPPSLSVKPAVSSPRPPPAYHDKCKLCAKTQAPSPALTLRPSSMTPSM